MLRVASFTALVAGLFSLAAFHAGAPKFSDQILPANSTILNFILSETEPTDDWEAPVSAFDSAQDLKILLLNYSVYDSAYALKMKQMVQRRLPGVAVTEFWSGTVSALSGALNNQHVVLLPYPAKGDFKQIKAFGKALSQFVQKGGAVVFCGTDQFGILQQYGLIDLDFGYFCSDLEVHEALLEHPLFQGTPADFSLANYVYPLDISDPYFVTLAEVRGYPVLGYKPFGAGKVVYIGLEYYYDEAVSTNILENTLRWLAPADALAGNLAAVSDNRGEWTNRSVQRREEMLFAGTGKAAATPADVDLKIYPNPYFEKATIDLSLDKSDPVAVEMTDETGVTTAVLLPYRQLNAGFYRLELPNVNPGVYFVKCQIGNQTIVRKVVKAQAQ